MNQNFFNFTLRVTYIPTIRFLSILQFIFCFMSLYSNPMAQTKVIKFEHITQKDGLSQSSVRSIIQDNKGFMWFATSDGLNRYDGYGMNVFKNVKNKSNSLSNNNIHILYKDKEGLIWIGTEEGGLNSYDPKKGIFIKYHHNPADTSGLSNNRIFAIYEAPSETGIIWIATNWGLDRLNKKTGTITHYRNNPKNPFSISNNYIRTILEDRAGNLWVGTWNGLNLFDRKKKTFIRFMMDAKNPYSISDTNINRIYQDKSNCIWIATNFGLNKLEIRKTAKQKTNNSVLISPDDVKFIRYQNNPINPNSISNNIVIDILEDRQGIIWIGTAEGLNQFYKKSNKFIQLKNNPDDAFSLSHNHIFCLYESRDGVIWIGTGTGGINKISSTKKKFFHFTHNPKSINSLINKSVFSFCESHSQKGVYWIGTTEGALHKLEIKNSDSLSAEIESNNYKITRFRLYPGNSTLLNYIHIRAMFMDNENKIWLGTTDGLKYFNTKTNIFFHYIHNPADPSSIKFFKSINAIYQDPDDDKTLWLGFDISGLAKFNKKNGKFTYYSQFSDEKRVLGLNRINCLYIDKNRFVWVGTNDGLSRFDPQKKQFVNFINKPEDKESISDNMIKTIYEDKSGRLWIGTANGLNLYDKQKNKFRWYDENSGLPNNFIYGILEDERGNLWITTNNGLSRFNPGSGTFKNYDKNDGLQDNEFNSGAYFKSKTGSMLIGGINGFNIFHPESIQSYPISPTIAVTKFQLLNETVKENEYPYLKNSIEETKEINLTYKDYLISFEFSVLDFAHPLKNQYAFMLEGLENKWQYIGSRRFVTFTTLPPGEYKLRIKGANNDGIWNETGSSIKITVSAPPWKTWWAFSFYIIAFAGLIIGFIRHRTKIHIKELAIKQNEIELRKKHEAAQEEALKNQMIAQEAINRENKSREIFARDLIYTQENERKRISGELHDGVGQNLLLIKNMLLSKIRTSPREEENESLGKICELTGDTIEEIRTISRNLRPQHLDQLGLTTAIETMIENVDVSSSINFEFRIDNIDNLIEKDNEINFYRIIQESINNIVKHSEATKVFISVDKTLDKIILEINDNGKGMINETKLPDKKGIGLLGIYERARMLNAEIFIDSTPQKGVFIKLEVNL